VQSTLPCSHWLLLGGSVRADKKSYNMEYTFEVFVCVAILLLHKAEFMKSPEAGDLYTCVNRWVGFVL